MSDLGQQAYEKLRVGILDGELPPGSPLSHRKLAQLFGISTIPVAAALQRLEAEGFVESRARAGTRVKMPTVGEISGNYIVREALESQAARLFAQSASPLQKQRLLRLANDLDKRYRRLDKQVTPSREAQAEVEKRHVEFHLEIARATGCQELVSAIEKSRVLLFNWLFSRSGEYVPLPQGWHTRLAEDLSSGQPLSADEAMRLHVTFRRDDILRHFAELEQAAEGKIERGPQHRKVSGTFATKLQNLPR
ncbi:MAG: GntR family transcriptional regulator [Acidobacteria bacterium]|nr:GntR family transcriptional regulator [Acidobacteriota bacterium]